MVTAWISVGIILIVIETVLWTVFHAKVHGLSFPHEADESLFRFFTVTRMRLIAILHTVFLIAIFMISSYFLW